MSNNASIAKQSRKAKRTSSGPTSIQSSGKKSGQIPGSKASQIYKDKAITWTPGTMVHTPTIIPSFRDHDTDEF